MALSLVVSEIFNVPMSIDIAT